MKDGVDQHSRRNRDLEASVWWPRAIFLGALAVVAPIMYAALGEYPGLPGGWVWLRAGLAIALPIPFAVAALPKVGAWALLNKLAAASIAHTIATAVVLLLMAVRALVAWSSVDDVAVAAWPGAECNVRGDAGLATDMLYQGLGPDLTNAAKWRLAARTEPAGPCDVRLARPLAAAPVLEQTGLADRPEDCYSRLTAALELGAEGKQGSLVFEFTKDAKPLCGSDEGFSFDIVSVLDEEGQNPILVIDNLRTE